MKKTEGVFYMRSNSEIVDIIVSLYTEKNWSLSEFARRLGFPKSSLSRYFNKNRKFPINKVNKFAEVLGVTSEYILGINESSDDILDIYSQLISERKKNVFNYAKWQLNEQNKIIELSNHIQEEEKMTLGEFIKKYRDDNKLSMDQFAKMSGVSKAYISVLEKNKRPKTGKPVTPSIPIVKNIAKAMNVSFDELFNMLEDD